MVDEVADNYIMINDIMEEHHARMLNLRKYYPFFVLNETTFNQYKDGKYADLDMGYITMASLRFFINENQFNEQNISYEQYELFLLNLLHRDFELEESVEEEQELVSYIFDKIKNEGRPFEFHFFDPEEKKKKTARVRLIESDVVNGSVEYHITAEGIEFYLDTKEIKDESKISVQQLLLEKMITAKNFKGGIDVVRRINSEVKRLIAQKDEVVELLGQDVFAGAKASEEYMAGVAKWFDEEQRLFAKNKKLIEQTLAKASLEGNGKAESAAFYRSLEEISALETELKKTIHRHGELIQETTHLQDIADKMIHQAKIRKLRNIFDYKGVLQKIMKEDAPEKMAYVLMPLFEPKITKGFSVNQIDQMLTLKSDTGDHREKVEKEETDFNFLYEDEIEDQRIAHNFARIFHELLDQLEKKHQIELKELNIILEIKYGDEFLKNGDYYSFLVHIAQKTEYSLKRLYEKPETFFENLIIEAFPEDDRERFAKSAFTLTFLPEEEIQIPVGEDEFTVTNILFSEKL